MVKAQTAGVMRKKSARIGAWLVSVVVLLPNPTQAHQEGAPFSGAIIDPLVLHHAHIENEQRVNLFALRKVDGLPRRNAFESELELGWSNDKFTFGMEAFIPYRRIPSPDGAGHQPGIGDIEIRPIKYAFVNQPDFVVATASGITLPTGSRARGLGTGNTTIAQHLFVDKAFGNVYLGINLGLDKRIRGERGAGMEYGAVVAYSFINGTSFRGSAASRPSQAVVVSASMEFIGNERLSGVDSGEKSTSLLPGLTLWWPRSGWQLHAGVNIPRSGTREAQRTFLFQLANHLNWEDIFKTGGR